MINLRLANDTDLNDLHTLEETLFPASPQPELFTRKHCVTYVLNDSEHGIVAYMVMNIKNCYISALGVVESFRGRGLATRLLEHAEIIANSLNSTEITLHVKINNTPALKCYTRQGYTITKILHQIYKDCGDGYLMTKRLNSMSPSTTPTTHSTFQQLESRKQPEEDNNLSPASELQAGRRKSPE